MISTGRKALLGMIHVRALPGSPAHSDTIDAIVEQAVGEARLYAETGFDGFLIENMHDRPYVHGVHGPEVAAVMTRVGAAVRQVAPMLTCGVQVLSGGNKEAMAIALAIGAHFIRCENFVFSHVADEGLLVKAEAGELLRYRRAIGAEHVEVYADIKKKHASHAITADVSIGEAAEAADFFGADGLVVTGTATGKATDVGDVRAVRRATRLPVLVGSGVTPGQIPELFEHADALIVGSYAKDGGRWDRLVHRGRCLELVSAADKARSGQGPRF